MAMPEHTPQARSTNPLDLVQRPTLAEAGTAAPAIHARPNEPFILAHSPQDWQVLDIDGEPTWVPVVSPIPVMPGLFGCRTLDANEPREHAMQDVVTWARSQGRTVVPTSLHVPAEFAGKLGEGPYMRKMACRAHPNDAVKNRYIQVWDVPVATPPGEEQVFVFDVETNAKWRASLVAEGVIQPPSELVMQRIIRAAESRPSRVAATPYPDKELKEERKQAAREYVTDRKTAKIPGAKPQPPAAPKGGKEKAA